jgi:cytochrome c biogenesis protein CcmG/thiol:disulfide interchange protein DsbE
MLRVARVVGGAFVLSLLVVFLLKTHLNDSRSIAASVNSGSGKRAPAFRLPVIWPARQTWDPSLATFAVANYQLALRNLAGRPVVLNFWASWCRPCRAEAPTLAEAARAHAGEIAFLGVNVEDGAKAAKEFLRRFGIPYVSVRDSGMSTVAAYEIVGLPDTFFLDSRGRIVALRAGEVTRNEVESGIARAIEPRCCDSRRSTTTSKGKGR